MSEGECDKVGPGREELPAAEASVTCTAVQLIAQWITEIEASNALPGLQGTAEGDAFYEYRDYVKRRLQEILDAINETRCEAGRANATPCR